ncbi:MAG: hypothetical protein E7391_04790 [Ruminococcaceae bacterium]|nr:hypothetical protein [Oscillospiraceae bacterium]
MENNEKFNYTYSAKEQEELKKIRQKYMPQEEEDSMQKIRQLDAGVYNKATTYSLILGIIGTLIMGLGMSCCMVWMDKLFIPGIFIGVLGIVLVCFAYPVYNKTLKKEREKIAPEIIRLTDELLK